MNFVYIKYSLLVEMSQEDDADLNVVANKIIFLTPVKHATVSHRLDA